MKKNGKNKIVLLALVLVLALSLTVTACAVTSQMENSPVESAVSQSVNVSRSFYRVGDSVTLGEKQASVGCAQITLVPTYVVYPNGTRIRIAARLRSMRRASIPCVFRETPTAKP